MGGLGPLTVTDVPVDQLLADLDPAQRAAYERLGHDSFTAWALRGWWAAHTERSNA